MYEMLFGQSPFQGEDEEEVGGWGWGVVGGWGWGVVGGLDGWV